MPTVGVMTMAATPGPMTTAEPRSATAATAVDGTASRAAVVRARRTRLWALPEVRWATAATVLFGLGVAAEFGGAPAWLGGGRYLGRHPGGCSGPGVGG